MNRVAYLANKNVQDFINWLEVNCRKLIINLNIPHSRFIPGGVHAIGLVGIDKVLPLYNWRPLGMTSGSWHATHTTLATLASALQGATTDAAAEAACRAILQWGGNRNWSQGAWPFIHNKAVSKNLITYLTTTRAALDLSIADEATVTTLPGGPVMMNAMLTKVHALNSNDGLVIYDSRVAASIAVLVEMWRIHRGFTHSPIPPELEFPSTVPARTVHVKFSTAVGPAQMPTGTANRARAAMKWTSAKIRLSWILTEVLTRDPHLFPNPKGQPVGVNVPLSDRLHAFEATLFMCGYDVSCF